MPTKINLLDFAKVTNVQTTVELGSLISTEVTLIIIAETEEEHEIVIESLLDNINGGVP